MYNIYEDREFKYSFEEVFQSEMDVWGKDLTDIGKQELKMNRKKFWDFFEEGKTKREVEELVHCPDRRTKIGKWAAAIYIKHGLHYFINYEGKYRRFVMYENRLIRNESNMI